MKSKILYAILSLLIAFGLWAYVITVENPESEDTFYNIPVVLGNESILNDNGLMVLSDEEPTVTLKLKGNRSDLSNLKNSDITVLADLSKVDGVGEKKLSYSVTFPGSTSFEIVDQSPREIFVNIAEWVSKEVDVVVSYEGSTPPEYIADTDGIELDNQKVTITGPKETVDQITQAVIAVNLEGQNQTISQSYRYTLCNEAGEPVDAGAVQTSVAEIQMTLRILRVKEVALLLEVTYGGGATEKTTQITIDPLTIKVAGSEKLLESLNSITLGAVNLAELLEDKDFTFPINLPEGIENISGVTEASVSIKFPGLKVKTLKVSRILASSSSSTQVTLATKVLEITVRGAAEQIDAMDEQDLYARVDCTDAEMGEGKFKAQIFIGTEFDTVGVVGTYYVYATLVQRGIT